MDVVRGVVAGPVVAVAAAGSWLAWVWWEVGTPAWWQITGAVLTSLTVTVLATLRLPGRIVAPAVWLGSTAAWCGWADAYDPTGLWALAAPLVAVGCLAAVTVVVPVTVVVRRIGRGARVASPR